MSTPRHSLEPLAEYLEPRFGNIYDYNLVVGDGGIDTQPWTPELRQIVKRYLVHEIDDEQFAAYLNEVAYEMPSGSTRSAQADTIIAGSQAWEVAYTFHLAAVKAVATLDELIGDLAEWGYGANQDDAGHWLDAHASKAQLAELAEFTNHPEWDPATPWYQPEPEGWYFAWRLTPPALLQAWHEVVGPSAERPHRC